MRNLSNDNDGLTIVKKDEKKNQQQQPPSDEILRVFPKLNEVKMCKYRKS